MWSATSQYSSNTKKTDAPDGDVCPVTPHLSLHSAMDGSVITYAADPPVIQRPKDANILNHSNLETQKQIGGAVQLCVICY